MTPLLEYIYRQPTHIKEILDFLHEYILSVDDGISGTIKWSVPYYIRRKSICYLNVLQESEVELCFTRAAFYAPGIRAQLDFKKRSRIAGITIGVHDDIPVDQLKVLFAEALRIDNR